MKNNKDAALKLFNALSGIDENSLNDELQESNDENITYEVMCQFDEDEPVYLAKNIPLDSDFKIVFKSPQTLNDDENFVEFMDQTTGKKIKIFSRLQK